MSMPTQAVVLSAVDLSEMVFDEADLTPVEVHVKVKGDPYVLREAGAGAAIAYNNAKMRAAKMEDGKLSGFDGVFEADIVLLGKCLHPVDKGTRQVKLQPNGDPHETDPKVIRRWLNRVYDPLVKRLKDISPGLEDKETRDTLIKQRENINKKLADLDRKEGKPSVDHSTVTPEDVAEGDSPNA